MTAVNTLSPNSIRLVLLAACMALLPATSSFAGELERQLESDAAWEILRKSSFQDRPIEEGAAAERLLQVKAPFRAEDPAVVPISVTTKPEPGQRIDKMHLFIDKNPIPLVGIFEFTNRSGRADLATRVRVDDFTYIRAIAETEDGKLYMTKIFVRSVGGCSAPPGASMKKSKQNLGRMKMSVVGNIEYEQPNLVQLRISHPNITGMAIDPITRNTPPAYFVKSIEVEYAGELVMKGNFTFSISQDPSFRFFFVPDREGELLVRAIDTKDKSFEHRQQINES
ncbi:MAG: quinoprotein dehydrogenase-associated SoxYZ-like carrier [Candidatus Porifericomitaceae bacterium WSBS_2022_MAG_OTU9]